MIRRIILILEFVLISFVATAQVPVIYNVTGGGAYCQGGSGVSISLSGSEVGVTYELWNGSSATGITLAGTGSALNFTGVMTAGTYTVIGTNGNGSTTMSGSAVVTVNALPIVSFLAQPGASTCIGVNVIYTTEDLMTNYVWGFPGTLDTDYTIISGGTITSNTVTIKYLTTGTKTLTINYTNSVGCTAISSTSSTVTTINPLPTTSPIYHQ